MDPLMVEVAARIGARLQAQYGNEPIPVGVIREAVEQEWGSNPGKGLPSEHCYNRYKGDRFPNTPMFEWVGDGLYRFVGIDARYTGAVMHYPKGGAARQVGEWVDGQLRIFE